MNFISRILADTSISPSCRWLVGTLFVRGEHKIVMHEVYELAEPFYNNRQMLKLFEEAIKAGYVNRDKLEDVYPEAFQYKFTAFEEKKKTNP